MSRIGCLLCLLIGLALPGCGAYVNIPSQRGDLATANPNLSAVANVEAQALRAALAEADPQQTYEIQLPEGSDAQTYQAVIRESGRNLVWAEDGPTPNPLIQITQVRIRTREASVDLTMPLNQPYRQLVTVDLEWLAGDGWIARDVQRWRLSVDPAQSR